jgi:hypothetical protein
MLAGVRIPALRRVLMTHRVGARVARLFAAVASGLFVLALAAPASASGERDIQDTDTRSFGMHNCPDRTALRGVHIGDNVFRCLGVGLTAEPREESAFADTGTQESYSYQGNLHRVHVCPDGSYMRGMHADDNVWTCVKGEEDPVTKVNPVQTVGDRFVDQFTNLPEPGNPGRRMHACPDESLMVGIHVGDNRLICQHFRIKGEFF